MEGVDASLRHLQSLKMLREMKEENEREEGSSSTLQDSYKEHVEKLLRDKRMLHRNIARVWNEMVSLYALLCGKTHASLVGCTSEFRERSTCSHILMFRFFLLLVRLFTQST